MEKITIRKMKIEKDSKEIILLRNSIWKVAYAHIFSQGVFDERDTQVDEAIKIFKSNYKKAIVYVAVLDDKIVGYCIGETTFRDEKMQKLGLAEINSLYIRPDFQGKGLGQRLFKKVADALKAQGNNKAGLDVFKDNLKARKFYEKIGGTLIDYEKEGKYPDKSGKPALLVHYVFDL